MGDSRDRKRFLSHQEIVQVRIQSNQRLLAALDLFEERVAADGQSAASAQRSLQVLVVLQVNQPTQKFAAALWPSTDDCQLHMCSACGLERCRGTRM